MRGRSRNQPGASEGSELEDVREQVCSEFIRGCASGAFVLPHPGEGRTLSRLKRLRQLGHGDLSLARLGEGHADALAILAEGGVMPPGGARLGVWAAGPLDELHATPTERGWLLEGRRRWCSGSLLVTHGLVTASAPDGERLFLMATDEVGFQPDLASWPALGLAASGTYDVSFEGVRVPAGGAVGDPGFYLRRPGFWAGALGVAAVWLGAAEAVAHQLALRAGEDPHALAHLGAVCARLRSLSALVVQAGRHADLLLERCTANDEQAFEELELLARAVRAEVEAGVTEVVARTGRGTGAEPLAHDGAHARRIADLGIYLRQSHAERDLATLGALALRCGGMGSVSP